MIIDYIKKFICVINGHNWKIYRNEIYHDHDYPWQKTTYVCKRCKAIYHTYKEGF